LDLAIIVLVLPVLLVLGAAIAVWIKAVSPGRVLFSQTRIGFKGEPFRIFKFRSMHENVETRNHRDYMAALAKSKASMTKLDEAGDARLIPGGRGLRRTALDELPQVLNVLRGEMSIVGPRPCLDYEYRLYNAAQRERFETLPGMTGYWQVNGKNSTTFEQMVMLDIHYVRRRSVWLNLGIILRTPLVIAQQFRGRASRVKLPRGIADEEEVNFSPLKC
jgi:lipopolysaccharide/colanic/teichoic acid biosynthesis glycosyltransferase